MGRPRKIVPTTKAGVTQFMPSHQQETDDEIEKRLRERFDLIETLTKECIAGDIPALIISGPAGLGKSFIVDKALKEFDSAGDQYRSISGTCRATYLYRSLLEYRYDSNIIKIDDCDSIYNDEIALNILKAAVDSKKERFITWGAETKMLDENGDRLETSFSYEGSMIFITNIDLAAMAKSGSKLAPHYAALMSRGVYVDLSIRSTRDYIIRIRQVIREGCLKECGLNTKQETTLQQYVEDNVTRFRELSVRTILKIANAMLNAPTNWQRRIEITEFNS